MFNAFRFAAAVVAVVIGAGVSAGSPERATDTSGARSVLEATELPAAIKAGGGNVVLLDVRGTEAFAGGHVPGAVRVPIEEWEKSSLSEETGLTHAQAWHDRIGAVGIDSDDTVLIYDDGKMTSAARVWFILQHFGVERAAVVNGGFPLIKAAADGGSLTLATKSEQPTRKVFAPSGDRRGRVGMVDRRELKAAIERGDTQVFDARTEDEFAGKDRRNNARAGHVPGAINLPY